MMKFTTIVALSVGLTIGANAGAVSTTIGTADLVVDPTKVATVINADDSDESDNTCYFVMRWNDSKGIENITFGVKYNSSETISPEALLEKVYEQDWRFYKSTQGALCFDLNGDMDQEGESSVHDHYALDGEGGSWVLTAPNASVENGDMILAEFVLDSGEKGLYADAPLFYLPAADTAGAWIAGGQSFALADTAYDLPVYINLCGGTINSVNFTYRDDPNISTTNTKIASMTFPASDAKAGNTIAHITTKGEGPIYIGSRINYKPMGETNNQYTDFSFGLIDITPAEIPLTGISWNFPSEPLQLSHSYMLADYVVLEPENATYSGGLSYKVVSSEPKSICGISSGKLTTRTTPGTAQISVTAGLDNKITATADVAIQLVNPVTSIKFVNIDPSVPLVIEFDPYKMEYNNTCALLKVEPENADISKLSLKLIDPDPTYPDEDGKVTFNFAGTDRKYDLMSTYQQNDGAYDLYAWGFGSTKAVFEATDGSGVESPELTILIEPRTMNITDEYSDGTFWLNEDWFGHSNGSINYLDADGNIHYRVYNFANFNEETPRENRTFGCTSQYGMIFGGRLYVMSKQHHDSGDKYQTGGGRLVIADAKTLKRIHSFDVIGADEKRGGDGRACVGVSADKVYIGHHAGIRVLNIDNTAQTPEQMFQLGKELNFTDENVGGDTTPDNPQGALYSNQIGDMVYACGHVFAVMQDRGLLVIDTENDEHIKTLGDKYTQAVTQSADGDIWYARNNKETGMVSLHRVNPETLEEIGEYFLPESAGTINTGWGAWRSANFFASRTKNILFWGNVGSGYQDDILGKGTGNIYRWVIDEELPTKPFFSLGETPGKDAETFQSPYATMRYDDRHDRILMATTHGASYNYRYNWIYFINGTSGEIERVQEPTRYFWFPAIPIFPDKHDPEIRIDYIPVPKIGEEVVYDLSNWLYDEDNNSRNINLRISEITPSEAPMRIEAKDEKPNLEYKVEGQKIYLKMNSEGTHTIKLTADSNGKEVSRNVRVAYDFTTCLGSLKNLTSASISMSGRTVRISGCAGVDFRIYDSMGILSDQFVADSDDFSYTPRLSAGIYMICGENGLTHKLKF